MAIELNIYPITPIIKGTYPQGTPLGKICLQNINSNDGKKTESHSRLLLGIVMLIIQFTYTLFFYWRIRRYVRRYGEKLCAIGKYKRNCQTLKTTAGAAILGCCFPNFSFMFRDVITREDTFAQFVAHFLFVDVCIDLFYTGLFLLAAKDDIPNMEETPRRVIFYVSRPKYLEPRRPEILTSINVMNSTKSGPCKVRPSDIQIPLVRVTRNAHRVTLYHATFKKKVGKIHSWGLTVKVPKQTQVCPWSEEVQFEEKGAKPKEDMQPKAEVSQEQETSSRKLDVAELNRIHDGMGCTSSEVCNIGKVDGTKLFRKEGQQHPKKDMPSSLDGEKDIYNVIERADTVQPDDINQEKIRPKAARFIYLI